MFKLNAPLKFQSERGASVTRERNFLKVPVEHEISVQVAYAIEYLVKKTLDHHFRHYYVPLVRLARPMEFYDMPKIVLGVGKHQPNPPVRVREEHSLQSDNVDVVQFSQELRVVERRKKIKKSSLIWICGCFLHRANLLRFLDRQTSKCRCLRSVSGHSWYRPNWKRETSD